MRCEGLTLRGTGKVAVTVPPACGTGLGGQSTFTVDLGPGQLTDEPPGVDGARAYGRTESVALAPL